MSDFTHRLLSLAKRELGRMTSRPIYLLSMICAPLFCYFFFTSLMKEGLPENIPAGVVDDDNTTMTRQITRNLDSFQQTKIVARYSNISEACDAMRRGEIYAFYYFPPETTSKTLRSEQPKVSFYTNAAYLIPASLLYRDMKMMSELASGSVGRENLLAHGYSADQIMGLLQPIQMDMRPVHNPWLSYSVYLCNTLLPAVLMLMIFMVTIFSIHTELKDNTGIQWMNMANGDIKLAVFGKLLPQTLIFFMMVIFYQIYLFGFLNFPHNGGMWSMILAGLMLVMASQGFAIFICSAIPSLRWSLSIATLWGVLSFSISGFSFPVMAMPPMIKSLSYLFPLRYYFLIYVDQALNGLNMRYSMWFYFALLLFILLPLTDIKRLKYSAYNYKYIP